MGPDSRHKAKLEKRQPSVLCSQGRPGGVGSPEQPWPSDLLQLQELHAGWFHLELSADLICPRALVSCLLLGGRVKEVILQVSPTDLRPGYTGSRSPGSFHPLRYSWGQGTKCPFWRNTAWSLVEPLAEGGCGLLRGGPSSSARAELRC